MHVEVDTDKCCGAGQCVYLAPDVFDQDEDTGIVVLLQKDPSVEQIDAVRAAVAACPATAIHADG